MMSIASLLDIIHRLPAEISPHLPKLDRVMVGIVEVIVFTCLGLGMWRLFEIYPKTMIALSLAAPVAAIAGVLLAAG